jgi:hypothetical protein
VPQCAALPPKPVESSWLRATIFRVIPYKKPIMPIKKAIFPVAGLGTRFLPATKAQP